MKRRGFIGSLLASGVGLSLPRKAVAKPEAKEETPDFGSILRRLGPPDGIASFDFARGAAIEYKGLEVYSPKDLTAAWKDAEREWYYRGTGPLSEAFKRR